MESKHDASYWINQFQKDSLRLGDDKKYELTRTLLIHAIPLQPDEADIFLRTNPNPTEMDMTLRYSGIERKVAHAYGARRELFDNSERIERFLRDFRAVLDGFYTQEDLDEIISYTGPNQSQISSVVMWLVGRNHPTSRRIRNAYLPEITTLIEVGERETRDVTHTLFDGEGDAVNQIENKILGNKKLD